MHSGETRSPVLPSGTLELGFVAFAILSFLPACMSYAIPGASLKLARQAAVSCEWRTLREAPPRAEMLLRAARGQARRLFGLPQGVFYLLVAYEHLS